MMKTILWCFVCCWPLLVTGQSKDKKVIEVIGIGKMEVKPNLIEIEITLTKPRKKGQKTKRETPKVFFTNLLKALGLENTQLFTKDQYGERWNAFTQKGGWKEYELVYFLQLKSPAEAHRFLLKSSLLEDKASFNIVKITHTQLDKLKIETKARAMRAAKEKATQLLKPVNGTLGSALKIFEIPKQPHTYNSPGSINEKIYLEYKMRVIFEFFTGN